MGAFTYPRSEPGSGGHQDLVERLNATVPELRRILASLSEEQIARRPAEGEWSMKEVCGHLRDHAGFFHQRLSKMATLENPFLASWDQEEVLRERNPQEALIQDLVYEFAQTRAETVELLADLVHWNWARQGRHEERGRLSIRQLVDFAIAHDEAHLAQLRDMRAAAKPAKTTAD